MRTGVQVARVFSFATDILENEKTLGFAEEETHVSFLEFRCQHGVQYKNVL